MSSLDFLAQEKIWFDKTRYDEAERRFYERVNGPTQPTQVPTKSQGVTIGKNSSTWTSNVDSCSFFFKDVGANTILQDIARARENIQKSLAGVSERCVPYLTSYLTFSTCTTVCAAWAIKVTLDLLCATRCLKGRVCRTCVQDTCVNSMNVKLELSQSCCICLFLLWICLLFTLLLHQNINIEKPAQKIKKSTCSCINVTLNETFN